MCDSSKVISVADFVESSSIIPSNLKKEEKMAKVKISEIPEIRGFSYRFCEILLGILKELKQKDKIFKEGIKSALTAEEKSNYVSDLDPVAFVAINHLEKQLMININSGRSARPSGISRLITIAEQFLNQIKKAERNETGIERL